VVVRIVFSSVLAILAAATCATGIDWRPNFAAAIQEAASSDKLVMIDFYNDWWSYCKEMDEQTLTDPGVVIKVGQFIPIKINGEKDGAKLAAQYHVAGYPTILFVDKEGRSVGHIDGFVFPPQFLDQVDQILDAHQNLDKYQARIKKSPSDALAAEKLVAIYARRGSIKDSLALLPIALNGDPSNRKGALTHALNAIGDYYFAQGTKDAVSTASSYFKRGLEAGQLSAEKSYSGEKLAQCYLTMGQPALAVPALNQVLNLSGLGPNEEKAVQTMLNTATREAGGGPGATEIPLDTPTSRS